MRGVNFLLDLRWSSRATGTCTETKNESTREKHAIILSRSHQDHTNDFEAGREEDTRSAAPLVGDLAKAQTSNCRSHEIRRSEGRSRKSCEGKISLVGWHNVESGSESLSVTQTDSGRVSAYIIDPS